MNLSPPDLPLLQSPSPPPSLAAQQSSSLFGNLRSKARTRGRGGVISGGGGEQVDDDDDDDDERSAAHLLSSKAIHEKKAATSTSQVAKSGSNLDTKNNSAMATGLKLLAEMREDGQQQPQQQSLAAISASIKRKSLGKKMKGALRRMVSHDDSIFSGHMSNIHSAHTAQTVDNQEDTNNNKQPITSTENAGRSPKQNLTKKFNNSMRSFITSMTPSAIAMQREGGDNSKRGRQRLTSVTSQVSLHLPLDIDDGNSEEDSADGDNDGSVELYDAFLLQPEKKPAAEAKSDAMKRRRERRQQKSLENNQDNNNSSSRLRRRHKQYRRVYTNQSATNAAMKNDNSGSSAMALNTLSDSTGKMDRQNFTEDKNSNKEEHSKQQQQQQQHNHHHHHHEHESRLSHSTSSKPRARSAPRSPSQKMVHRVREDDTPAQGGRIGEAFLLSVLDDIRAKKRASGELKTVLDDDDNDKDGDYDVDADAADGDAKEKDSPNKKKKNKKKTIKPKRPGAGLLRKDKSKNKPKPSSDTDALSPEEEEELALLGPEVSASPPVRVVAQGGLGGWRRGSFLSEVTMQDLGRHGSNIEEPTEEDVSTMMPSLDPCSQGPSDTGTATGTGENEDNMEDRKRAKNPLKVLGSSSRRDSSKDDGDSILRAMYEEDSLPLVKRSNDALRMEVKKNLKHLSILKHEDPPNSESEIALKTEVEKHLKHLSIIKQGDQINARTKETSDALKMEIEKKLKIIIGEESGSPVRKRVGRATRLEAETNLENFMVHGIQHENNPSGLTEEMDLSNKQQRRIIRTPKQGTTSYKDKFPFSLDSLIADTKNGDSPTSMDDSVILDFKAYQAKENAEATSSRRHGGLTRRRSCPNFEDACAKPDYSNLHQNLNFRFDTDDARFFSSQGRETKAQPQRAAEDERSVGSGSGSRRGRSRSSRNLVNTTKGVTDRRDQKARRKENSARSLPSGDRTNSPTKRTIKQLSDSHIDTKRIRDRSQSGSRHSSRVSKSLQSKSLSKREIAAEERERRKGKRTRRSISKSLSKRRVNQRERSRSTNMETSREKSRSKHSSFRSGDEGGKETTRERSRSKSHRESRGEGQRPLHTHRDRSKSKSSRGAGLTGRHPSKRSERLHQSESQINYHDRPRKRSQSKRSERGLSISDNAHDRISSRPRPKSVESIKKRDKHPDSEIQGSADDELKTGKKKTKKALVDSTDSKTEKTKRREKKGRSDGRLIQSDGNLVYHHHRRTKSKSTRSRRSDDMPERSERKSRSERIGERTSESVSKNVRTTKGKSGMEAWGNQSDVTLNIRNIIDETGEDIHATNTESHVSGTGRESRPSRRDSVDCEDRGRNRSRSRSLDRARRSQQIVNDAKEELEKLIRQSAVAGGTRDGPDPDSPVSKSTGVSQPSDVEWKRVTPDKEHSVKDKSNTDKEHIKSNGNHESSAHHRSSDKGPENSPRRKEKTKESDRPAAAEEVGWSRVATSNPESEVKDESLVENTDKKRGHRSRSKPHGESGTKSHDVSKSRDKKDDGGHRSRKERDSTDKKSTKRSSGGDRVDRSRSDRVSRRQQENDKDKNKSKGEAQTGTTATTTITKEHKSRHHRGDEKREHTSRLHSSGIVTSTRSQQRRSRDGKDEGRKCQSERQTRTIDKAMIVESHHSSSSSERNDRTVGVDPSATPAAPAAAAAADLDSSCSSPVAIKGILKHKKASTNSPKLEKLHESVDASTPKSSPDKEDAGAPQDAPHTAEPANQETAEENDLFSWLTNILG